MFVSMIKPLMCIKIFDKLNIPLCFKVSENHVMLLFVFPIILFGCAKSNQMLGR